MIKATVFDKKLSVENFTVSDGVKFDTIRFEFPDSWKGYQKTAVFKNDSGVKINILLDVSNPLCLSEEECFIPHQVLVSPCFYLSVYGIKDESIATTTIAKVKVLKSGYIKGDEPLPPTYSEYEQILSLVSEAKNTALSVRQDADNGLFNGEKGDKGEKGDRGEKGEKGDEGKPALTDSFFDANSKNAQSGIAIAQKLNDYAMIERYSMIGFFEKITFLNNKVDINGRWVVKEIIFKNNDLILMLCVDEKTSEGFNLELKGSGNHIKENIDIEMSIDIYYDGDFIVGSTISFTCYKDLKNKADVIALRKIKNQIEDYNQTITNRLTEIDRKIEELNSRLSIIENN